MTVTHIKRTLHDRVAELEERTKVHDGMVDQVKELYDAWTTAKKLYGGIRWFRVSVIGGIFAVLGAAAAALTIWEKVGALLGHH